MVTKDEDGLLIPVLLGLLAVLFFVGIISQCSTQDLKQAIFVCAPFAALLIPGYLNLLPEGGITHGSRCYCVQPDEFCEFGFWFQVAQKTCLIIPILLSSIFIYYMLSQGLWQAVEQTLFAIWMTAVYACLYLAAVVALLMIRYR